MYCSAEEGNHVVRRSLPLSRPIGSGCLTFRWNLLRQSVGEGLIVHAAIKSPLQFAIQNQIFMRTLNKFPLLAQYNHT